MGSLFTEGRLGRDGRAASGAAGGTAGLEGPLEELEVEEQHNSPVAGEVVAESIVEGEGIGGWRVGST